MNPGRFTLLAAALAAVALLTACAAGWGSHSITPAILPGLDNQVTLADGRGNGVNTTKPFANTASLDETGQTFVVGITDSLLAARPTADEAFQVLGASAPDTVIRGIAFTPLPR